MMRQFRWIFSVVGIAVAMAVPNSHATFFDEGKSLEELRIRQSEEQALRQEVAFTSEQCGTNISASINWNASSSWPRAGKGLAKACDGALGALEAVCRGGGSGRVQSKISSFECSGNGTGPSLSGRTLRFGAKPGENGFSSVKAFLDSRL